MNFVFCCRSETLAIVYGGITRVGILTNAIVASTMIHFPVFVVYVLLGGDLNTRNVFVTFNFIYQIRIICLFIASQGVWLLFEGMVAIERIQVRVLI